MAGWSVAAFLLALAAAMAATAAGPTPAAEAKGGKGDLVMRSVSAPKGKALVGKRVRLSAQVGYKGKRRAPKTVVRFFLSRNKSWSSADVVLGEKKLPRLKAGDKRALKTRERMPQGAPRLERLFVLACADDDLRLAEKNEGNNCKAKRGGLVVAGRTPSDTIDADVLLGDLSRDKAILYKLFGAFGDPRLPKRYSFPGGLGADASAVAELAMARLASMPAKIRAQVEPFLLPPIYRESFAARGGGRGRAQAAQLDQCSVRTPPWNVVPSGSGALIWWNSARPEDEARAKQLAAELQAPIWTMLTGLMVNEPLPDARHRCSGIDGRLDVYLHPIPDPVTEPMSTTCGPVASDIIFPPGESRAALAHEFMHVLQNTYTRRPPCTDLFYLKDATATWAEDYVYPRDNSEHQYTEMLRFPDIRFNQGPGYPAWTLFYSVSRRAGEGIVPSFHAAAANRAPLDALDAAFPGGLDTRWPLFALDAWNQPLPPALTKSFFNWDPPLPAKPDVDKKRYALEGKRSTFNLPIELLGMGRQYQHIDLSDKSAKLVTFLDPGPTELDSKLRTFAYYRLADGTWKVKDWTGEEEVEFCRDSADVREVILVHSTTTRPRGADGGDLVLKTNKPRLRLTDKCDPNALFDVVAANGTYDWELDNRDPTNSCVEHRDVHWTSTLAPGAEPARYELYYRDNQDRPVYIFSASRIPLTAHGTGVATETCSEPEPGSNGTVRCNIDVTQPSSLTVGSDSDATTADSMVMNWYWGFNSFGYDPTDGFGGNGGRCTYSGERPPSMGDFTYSAGLFVHPQNDGSNAAEPPGISRVSPSSFGEDTVTLTFSGSKQTAYADENEDSTATFSWSMTVTFRRR